MVATHAYGDRKRLVCLLSHKDRMIALTERRKPKHPLFGMQPELISALGELGDFQTVEDFIEAAKNLNVEY